MNAAEYEAQVKAATAKLGDEAGKKFVDDYYAKKGIPIPSGGGSSSARPTPAMNGAAAAAARPLAPTPAQTAPAAALHPGEYTNVADIRRLDSARALEVGRAMADAVANPHAAAFNPPLIEYLLPSKTARSGASIRAQALGDLKRREEGFAQAPARRAAAAEAYERSLAAIEARLQAERRAAEGRPPDYYDPEPSKTLVPAPAPVAAKPAPVVGPVAGPVAAKPAPVASADWPGLTKADARLKAWNPAIDLTKFSAEERLQMSAELKEKQ